MPVESICQNNTLYVLKVLLTTSHSPFTYRKTPCSPEYNVSVATKQESPAVADKPARCESMPKIAQIRPAYNVVADWSIFVRLTVIASEICEIPRNSLKIHITHIQSSNSSKVIDLGTNQKRICTFLLVTNSNFGRISYRFRDIDTFTSKIACFPYPSLV